MYQDQTEDWRELCKAAANEQDPTKLMALVTEIGQTLVERDRGNNGNRGIMRTIARQMFPQ